MKSKAKHLPGPFTLGRPRHRDGAATITTRHLGCPFKVAVVFGPSVEMQNATAALFIAAPRMFDLLEKVLEAASTSSTEEKYGERMTELGVAGEAARLIEEIQGGAR